ALGGIARPVRNVIHVAPLGRWTGVRVAHGAHQAQNTLGGAFTGLPFELEILEALGIGLDPDCAIDVLAFQVLLPQPIWFENIPVRIDSRIVREAFDLVHDGTRPSDSARARRASCLTP